MYTYTRSSSTNPHQIWKKGRSYCKLTHACESPVSTLLTAGFLARGTFHILSASCVVRAVPYCGWTTLISNLSAIEGGVSVT